MKVIIAGSRTITDSKLLMMAILESGFDITEIVSGGARGVDTMGELTAEFLGIPCSRFPADWKTHGRHRAGPIRNRQMADYAEALIAIWDGESSGTKDMIEVAVKKGLRVHVVNLKELQWNSPS